jgi:5-methyltetrahydropteroyltriglutamate--homocysteine methyltransferase
LALQHPPFRAEHIGSLLRPAHLLDMRRRRTAGEVSADELTQAENEAIRDAVALQERVGLKLATDGEFRRQSYHSYFFEQLGDVSIDSPPIDEQVTCEGPARAGQSTARVGSRLKWRRPIHVEDFNCLKLLTGALPKITVPGPCALHFRGGDAAAREAYEDLDQYWTDLVEAFAAELAALAAAGCTYVQIDETAFAKFGDPEVQATLAGRGDDWRSLIDKYIAVTNRVLDKAPSGMRIGMHLCRGNRGGHFHAEGSYDVVAEKLFNDLNIGFYFMEYDSPRAGDFSPLRHVPGHKSIILGLISTKTSAMEDKNTVKRRVEEASRYVDMDRLAVSPQCGFASIEAGNPITREAQEQKLRLVVEVAEELWGTA